LRTSWFRKIAQMSIKTFGVEKFGSPLFFPRCGQKSRRPGEINGSSFSKGSTKPFTSCSLLDKEVMGVTILSCRYPGPATLISFLLDFGGDDGALAEFPGRKIVVSLIQHWDGLQSPCSSSGLLRYDFLWRNGPLGFLESSYTPTAMILAQAVIATSDCHGINSAAHPGALAEKSSPAGPGFGEQHGSKYGFGFLVLREAKLPLLAGVMAGFWTESFPRSSFDHGRETSRDTPGC